MYFIVFFSIINYQLSCLDSARTWNACAYIRVINKILIVFFFAIYMFLHTNMQNKTDDWRATTKNNKKEANDLIEFSQVNSVADIVMTSRIFLMQENIYRQIFFFIQSPILLDVYNELIKLFDLIKLYICVLREFFYVASFFRRDISVTLI